MKDRSRREARTALGLVAVAALLAALVLAAPGQAGAQVTCPTSSSLDFDKDGFTDQQECMSQNLAPGVTLFGATDTTILLDPNNPDVFVILVPDISSRLPANPFSVLTKSVASGGLGLSVHRITLGPGVTSRVALASSLQQAARCTEDNSLATSDVLGESNWGTPNGLDECIVRMLATENFVKSVYASNGFTVPSLCDACEALKAWVTNHEFGHMVRLRLVYDASFAGHHYKTGGGYLHDQATTYRKTRTGILFSIPNVVSPTDATDKALTP